MILRTKFPRIIRLSGRDIAVEGAACPVLLDRGESAERAGTLPRYMYVVSTSEEEALLRGSTLVVGNSLLEQKLRRSLAASPRGIRLRDRQSVFSERFTATEKIVSRVKSSGRVACSRFYYRG